MSMTYFHTPVSALYSSPEGEVRVKVIASDVSRIDYPTNVMLIELNDSKVIVPEGYLS